MADDKNDNSETKQEQENLDASGTGGNQEESSKEVDPVLAEKTKKYVEKLLSEKLLLDNAKHPNAIKLLKQGE